VHGRRIAQNDCDGRRAWCIYSLVTLSVERVIRLKAFRNGLKATLSGQVRRESRLTMKILKECQVLLQYQVFGSNVAHSEPQLQKTVLISSSN